MKLTCVLIIAVLFLTACQLTTGEQKDHAQRSADRNSKLTRQCTPVGGSCSRHYHCCSLYCNKNIGQCLATSYP
uniref:Conotoxin ArMKLT2-022 n=1 Tax=Conus arenatus TaxID=89451 RepID=O1617_CONAE|nr:RecName: Full=Conotoxin ArMKLT2-022; Flags: Precursor [Conus arenatus]AAG60487.1 conotoxin scaffold VI/VII precursor [Conus arenatus]